MKKSLLLTSVLILLSYSNIGITAIKTNKNIKEQTQCFKSLNKNLMQSFYVTDNETWISYDNEKRDHQVIEKYVNNKLISTQNYIAESSVGHLDGIYVDNDIIYATDKYTSPSIIKLQDQKIIERIEYPLKISSNQVLAIDRNRSSDFAVWASDSSNKKIIYKGVFDEGKHSIISFIPSKIKYPEIEVLQGLALDNNIVYALTGKPNQEIKLYSWNILTGTLLQIREILPYVKNFGIKEKYEPEGLNIIKTNKNIMILSGTAIISKKEEFFNCIAPLSIN